MAFQRVLDALMDDKWKGVNCVARALYDNIAESPDELAFRKGDLLTVLEQNTGGLEGWWMCSLRGRQGICPGNRLRILPGVYDAGTGIGGTSSLAPHLTTSTSSLKNTYDTPASHNGDATQPPGKRRSWHVHPNKVVTPQKVGDVYLYDVPQTAAGGADYDVPPTRHVLPTAVSADQRDASLSPRTPASPKSRESPPTAKLPSRVGANATPDSTPTPPSDLDSYDIPRPIHVQVSGGGDMGESSSSEAYDIPRSHHIAPGTVASAVANWSNRSSGVSLLSTTSSQLSPSSSASSLTASESLSLSNRSSMEHAAADAYDIPPSRHKVPLATATAVGQQDYDIPKLGGVVTTDVYDIPRVLAPPEGVYDVPPQVMRDGMLPPRRRSDECDNNGEKTANPRRLSSGSESSRDSRDIAELLAMTSLIASGSNNHELPLELASAVDTLVKLQQEVHGAITKMLAYVNPNWRKRDVFEPKMYDMKVCLVRLRTALQEFAAFAQGALVNASKLAQPHLSTLAPKLLRLTRPVLEANETVETCSAALDAAGWTPDALCRVEDKDYTPDHLDRIVACTRELTEDVRLVASFIQGNSTLLFKRSTAVERSDRPFGGRPHKEVESVYENDSKEWIEDYDYVSLQPKDGSSDAPPIQAKKSTITDPNDKQLLQFYSSQVDANLQQLNVAIDAFLQMIERNQPPKTFVGHAKIVVLSAHKSVYLGDTIHRNLVTPWAKARVQRSANNLFDGLKNVVQATKKAATMFPSVMAVQEMVDSVVDVSHLAVEFKKSITVAN